MSGPGRGNPIRGWLRGMIPGLFAIAALAPVAAVSAADWGQRMFPEPEHDFGVMPRGARLVHDFPFVNHLREPVTVMRVEVSCGCVAARAATTEIAPGERGTIVAEIDSSKVFGRREVAVTVLFRTASDYYAEARLRVGATIPEDLAMSPGFVDFGFVAPGGVKDAVLAIERRGVTGFRVTRMVSAYRHIEAELREVAREGDVVRYELRARLKPDAPIGPIRAEIRLHTNDPSRDAIPVLVAGLVRPPLTVSPPTLALGTATAPANAKPGTAEGLKGRLIVRGDGPFRLARIEGDGRGFEFAEPSNALKPVHTLSFRVDPAALGETGEVVRVFRLHTDRPGETAEFTVKLRVNPNP